MKTLLLWDIDGTLLQSGGAGERALVIALREEFDVAGTLEDIELAGRTDRWIARQVLAKFALPTTPEAIDRYLDAYLRALPQELFNPGAKVLPGVRDLVTALAQRPDVAQGLLTGNLQRGAEIKLRHHELWTHFAFGAFADDAELRNELGPHAVRRANDHHAVEFSAERVFVIGDTPHDIACGKAIGACTVGVATGRFSVEELNAFAPTVVLPDLSDSAAFLRLL
ncbi:MAG: haloacid dehalogenase-like hydrolase [Opitutus sp.]